MYDNGDMDGNSVHMTYKEQKSVGVNRVISNIVI